MPNTLAASRMDSWFEKYHINNNNCFFWWDLFFTTNIIGGTTIHNLGYAFVIMPIFFNSLILLTIAMAIATFRDINPF
jgi:hypothetical protein